ncbi:MAG: hypothetical protein ABIQ93_03760, partial [Saprospiraceae bacterium]
MKNIAIALLLAFFCGQAHRSFAQTAVTSDTTLYNVNVYIKVAPGMVSDYLKMEKAFKKIHAAKK